MESGALKISFFGSESLLHRVVQERWNTRVFQRSNLVHTRSRLWLLWVSSRRHACSRPNQSHLLKFRRFIISRARLPLVERETAWAGRLSELRVLRSATEKKIRNRDFCQATHSIIQFRCTTICPTKICSDQSWILKRWNSEINSYGNFVSRLKYLYYSTITLLNDYGNYVSRIMYPYERSIF